MIAGKLVEEEEKEVEEEENLEMKEGSDKEEEAAEEGVQHGEEYPKEDVSLFGDNGRYWFSKIWKLPASTKLIIHLPVLIW